MSFYRCLVLLVATLSLSVSVYGYRDYSVVGQGNMRWFMINLYEARLLSEDGRYLPNQRPVALEISYKKRIRKSSLIGATKSEWQRMSVVYSPDWLAGLNAFWPDVDNGDVLTLHVDSDGVSVFYFNQKQIGTINDQDFSQAFLSIWLSDKSSNQRLRNKLLGKSSGN